MTLLYLDELPALSRSLRLFGHEKARPLCFRDRDHFEGSGRGVRAELESLVRAEGLEVPKGRVLLLTNCRLFGHVFNPVSFYYCHDADGRLSLVVAEVNNTFGDRHSYVLPVAEATIGPSPRDGTGHTWRRKKLMHVSPFTRPDAGTYVFELPPPGPRVEASIDLTRSGGTVVATRLSLEARPMSDRAILSALVRCPFQTVKVMVAIHWEALRLWWKGAPFWSRPPYDPAAAQRGPA